MSFCIGDHVQLMSDGFEEDGLYQGDTGTVLQISGNEIKIRWDNGADDSWVPSEACV